MSEADDSECVPSVFERFLEFVRDAFLEKKLKKVSDLDKDATVQVSRRIFLLFSRVQVLALYC